jgi:Flp pilus assembly protein TadG
MVSRVANHVRRRATLRGLLLRWRRNEDGATAIEFAIIALPFVMLLFGLVSVCLYYFADFSMENATWQAARAIRTGQLQQGQGSYAGLSSNADRQKALKKAFCDKAFLFPDCNTKAVVIVQSNTGFGNITQPNCTSNGSVISESAAAFNTGGSSSVVLVTICYPWDFGGKLPMFNASNLNGGALLMQASAAFRTEPYE